MHAVVAVARASHRVWFRCREGFFLIEDTEHTVPVFLLIEDIEHTVPVFCHRNHVHGRRLLQVVGEGERTLSLGKGALRVGKGSLHLEKTSLLDLCSIPCND